MRSLRPKYPVALNLGPKHSGLGGGGPNDYAILGFEGHP